MITCVTAQAKMSAYVDAELDDGTQSAVRGHLRTCETCRGRAEDLAAIRDGLHGLAAPSPPPALWASVQRAMATAEVEDSKRSGASRWLQRMSASLPRWPMLVGAGAATLVVGGLVWSRDPQPARGVNLAEVVATPTAPDVAVPTVDQPVGLPPEIVPAAVTGEPRDVVDELAIAAGLADRQFSAAATELLELVSLERSNWSAADATKFDVELGELTASVATAEPGRPREVAWRQVMAHLQRALVTPATQVAGLP